MKKIMNFLMLATVISFAAPCSTSEITPLTVMESSQEVNENGKEKKIWVPLTSNFDTSVEIYDIRIDTKTPCQLFGGTSVFFRKGDKYMSIVINDKPDDWGVFYFESGKDEPTKKKKVKKCPKDINGYRRPDLKPLGEAKLYFNSCETKGVSINNIHVLIKNDVSTAIYYQKMMRFDLAYQHFKVAADRGITDAMPYLALYLADGIGGCEENPDKAFKIAQDLANEGSERGELLLARFYAEGIGVEKNKIKALKILSQQKFKRDYYACVLLELINNNIKTKADDGNHVDPYTDLAWLCDILRTGHTSGSAIGVKEQTRLLYNVFFGHIFYCAAENELNELRQIPESSKYGFKVIPDLRDKYYPILCLYYCAAINGYPKAKKRIMGLRNGNLDELKEVYALPIYKYIDLIKNVRTNGRYDFGAFLITDMNGNPAYCVSAYFLFGKPSFWECCGYMVASADEHNAFKYSQKKKKWVEVPVSTGLGYRFININKNNVICYENDSKYSCNVLSDQSDLRLYSVLPQYNGKGDSEYADNIFTRALLWEYYYYDKDVAVRDMSQTIGDHSWYWSSIIERYTSEMRFQENPILVYNLLLIMSNNGIEAANDPLERIILKYGL